MVIRVWDSLAISLVPMMLHMYKFMTSAQDRSSYSEHETINDTGTRRGMRIGLD